MNLGYVKLKLLREGVNFDKEALKFVGKKYTERILPYNCGDEDSGKIKKIPATLLLGKNIVVTTRYRENSDWHIKAIGNKNYLFYKHKKLTPIYFAERPEFYNLNLKNGKKVNSIITQYCAYNLGIFVRRSCFYWEKGKQCKFCSLGYNKKVNRDYESKLDWKTVRESLKIALENSRNIKNIEWGGGNLKDNDEGLREIIKIIKKCNDLTNSYNQHICIMPPDNLKLLKKVKEAGIEKITFSLEVFNKKKFKSICPGKDIYYGRNKFLKALKYAVKIFGEGNVSCNLIAGLEPYSSIKQAYFYFFEKGIIPSVPIFHPDKGSLFEKKNPPSEEFLLKQSKLLSNLYKKYKYKPILHNARGASTDSEIYRGYFDEI